VRICVAWFRFGLNGSIGRFLRMARALAPFGAEVDFLSLTGETGSDWPELEGRVLGPADVGSRTWDAVMVPGAGNPADPLELLAGLRQPRYGRRIQHVLNDTSRKARFLEVNRILDPDVVVFNNGHWSPRDYRTFSAKAFRTVPGAVDVRRFRPDPGKTRPAREGRWTIGANARKNLEPVLVAMDELPADHVLALFGEIPGEHAAHADALLRAGRLVPRGPLHGDRLVEFYRGLDVMVSPETAAGWCNPAAEAMACGVPCVVSRAGTIDFVEPGRDAVVLEAVDGPTIAREIAALVASPERMRRIARRATDRMVAFDWSEWSARLLEIVREPLAPSYFRIPELGLHGKWEPETRLEGLEPILAEGPGASVLDLGAAEGIVALEMARHGAARIHAFEKEANRVETGRRLLAAVPGLDLEFRPADLSDWDAFAEKHADVLDDDYDVVLYLGLHHHLPAETRRATLEAAMRRCRRWLAVRTPRAVAEADGLLAAIRDGGFRLETEGGETAENLGWLGIFRREEAPVPAGTAPREASR
jgi:glycosyltransferase involved in cell wall biosynthesis